MAANAGSEKDRLVLKNVLASSRSPYVRGHSENPVAWQMWSQEAIELAKKHNRLIFISIGYAACHWCHVMERESFENEKVAKILNELFIPIKIDREERPDIDRIYMNYVQAISGHGGWPMSVFITPELEPVFGGTYWPGPDTDAVKEGGHPGFLGILAKVSNLWQTDEKRCRQAAKSVTLQLQRFAQNESDAVSKQSQGGLEALDLELVDEAYDHFVKRYDKTNGGFGNAPKFPTPVNLAFLLLMVRLPRPAVELVGEEECKNATSMAVETLRKMALGGIHDHIGNGFARYSVTQDWSLPHFEKMLYDQGQLLSVYLDAFLITGNTEMLESVHDIATYLTSYPMAAKNGGFYSSEDADSLYRASDKEKREGAFYVWTEEELRSILNPQEAEICSAYWDVQKSGNVDPSHDAHDELQNQNVLAISCDIESLAKEHNLSPNEVKQIIQSGRAKLLNHRNTQRPRPALDDKIVVGWNGLAIGALARTAAALQDTPDHESATRYLQSATNACSFIRGELYNETSGQLKRVYREGAGEAPGFADDYAFLISGLIDLYEATFDDRYLEFADALQKTQNTLFWDAQKNGFFSTQDDQKDVIMRLKDSTDGAEPSTNGVSASNLYKLGSLLEDEQYTSLASKTVQAFAEEASQHPFLFTSMMTSIIAGHFGLKSVVMCGEDKEVKNAIHKARVSLKPNVTIARLGGSSKSSWLLGRNKLLAAMDANKPALQVCYAGSCQILQPTEGEKAISQQ